MLHLYQCYNQLSIKTQALRCYLDLICATSLNLITGKRSCQSTILCNEIIAFVAPSHSWRYSLGRACFQEWNLVHGYCANGWVVTVLELARFFTFWKHGQQYWKNSYDGHHISRLSLLHHSSASTCRGSSTRRQSPCSASSNNNDHGRKPARLLFVCCSTYLMFMIIIGWATSLPL